MQETQLRVRLVDKHFHLRQSIYLYKKVKKKKKKELCPSVLFHNNISEER